MIAGDQVQLWKNVQQVAELAELRGDGRAQER